MTCARAVLRAVVDALRDAVGGGEKMSILQPGSAVPEVRVSDDSGRAVSFSDYKGKDVILFFYPRADTPG